MNKLIKHKKLLRLGKRAHVTLIFKTCDKYDLVNYRSISLTCNQCKNIEKIVAKKLTKLFQENKVMNKCQFYFLLKRSVMSNL